MDSTTRHTIIQEINASLETHLDTIATFGVQATLESHEKLECVIDSFLTLHHLTSLHLTDISREKLQNVIDHLQSIEHFFSTFNCLYLLNNHDTEIGRLYAQIDAWYQNVPSAYFLSPDQVWNLIQPVSPDTLTNISKNRFEAFWADPVPMMDIEILRRTQGIDLIEEPIRTDGITSGLTVKFAVLNIDSE